MACWVVNEWLLHDLKGENGQERQKEADRFLDMLIRHCDIIVFVSGSPWAKKAYELMKFGDPKRRLLSKKLWGLLRDANKRLLLKQDELQPLPEELQQVVKQDDWYLHSSFKSSERRCHHYDGRRFKRGAASFRYLYRNER
ncbi:MAG: hypothetical protein RMK94_01375 [Armatimonadota bacterium]|nr:hypothetical protein [Armatimonadota bacterium]